MVDVSRPPGINVGVNNPGTIVYVTGNESTDGSIRYQVTDVVMLQRIGPEPITEIQKRVDGIWQPTSFKTGAGSVLVGTLVALSAAGTNLITVDTDENINFNARSSVENGVTAKLANIVFASEFLEEVVFFGATDGEFTGTIIERLDENIELHLISNKFYLKTGSTAATEPLRFQTWDGVDDGGTLIFDQTYPASNFAANVDTTISLEGFLEFTPGGDSFSRISSPADFSLLTNTDESEWYVAGDVSVIQNDDLLQTSEYIEGNTFTQGDWTTQGRKVFECNVTGVQTGIFEDNLDKWNQLISLPKSYADIAARDADAGFQINENINRMVQVDSPVSYYMLVSVGPSVWLELSPVNGNAVAFVNDNGGTSIAVSAVNVWTDISDVGIGLIWALAPSLDNFSLTDSNTGEITYNGFIACGVRLGGSVEVGAMAGMIGVEIGVSINGAAPTDDTITKGFVTPVQLDSITISPAKVFINAGDESKLQIRNITNGTGFTIFQAKNVVF